MKTLLLIGFFISGEVFSQEMPADTCFEVAAVVAAGGAVKALASDGIERLIANADCREPEVRL